MGTQIQSGVGVCSGPPTISPFPEVVLSVCSVSPSRMLQGDLHQLDPRASIKLSPLHGKQISIRYLDMTDCFVLEDEGLHTIAAHCTQPQPTCTCGRCVRLTDKGLPLS